ncbi:MAG: hypothetical protein K2I71_00030 [Helicobacter sp.]|nr:hypothetical protein [Helicobacter sp.]
MKIFSSIVFFSLFSIFAFAQDSFTQEEIESLFIKDSKPLELIALSNEEMRTTEGAWLPFVGAFVGGSMYGIRNFAYQIKRNRPWSWGYFIASVGRGAYKGWKITTPMGVAAMVLNTPTIMGGRMIRASIMNRIDRYRR